MRHHNANRKLGRKKNQRRALLKTLAVSLISKERILTTEAKAKELRPFVEKLVTKAKHDNLNNRRLVARVVGETSAKKTVAIASKYKTRNGGYTRVVKAGQRLSDGSPMAYIEFV